MGLLSQRLILQGMLHSISAADAKQQDRCWRDAASQTHDIKSAPASGAAQLPELSQANQTLPKRLSGISKVPNSSAEEMRASARHEESAVRQPQRPVPCDSRTELSRQSLSRSHSAPLQSSVQRPCSGQTASSCGRPGIRKAPAESLVQRATAAAKQAELSLHSCGQPGTPHTADKQAQYSRLSRTRQTEANSPPKSRHMRRVGSVTHRSRSEGRLDESAFPGDLASTGHCSGTAHEERCAETQAGRHGCEAAPEAARHLQHVFTVCVQSLEGLDRLRGHGCAPGDACHISYTLPGRALGCWWLVLCAHLLPAHCTHNCTGHAAIFKGIAVAERGCCSRQEMARGVPTLLVCTGQPGQPSTLQHTSQ